MSKKTDTWMPLYIGDYLADTSRLSTEQHGAYLLILMDYWRNGPPPSDDDTLASICKLSVKDWRRIAPAIRRFFTDEDGALHQKRMDQERLKAVDIGGKRKAAGAEGAAKRWGKPIASAMANGMANASQSDACAGTPSPSQPPIPEIKRAPTSTGVAREPDTGGHEPTPAGLVCRAMRRAGMPDVNPGDPRLLTLIAQGATAAEFEGLAAEAVSKGKGFAWVLVVLSKRREEAAAITLAPPVPERPEASGISPQVEATRRMLAERDAIVPTKPPAEVLALVGRIGKVSQ